MQADAQARSTFELHFSQIRCMTHRGGLSKSARLLSVGFSLPKTRFGYRRASAVLTECVSSQLWEIWQISFPNLNPPGAPYLPRCHCFYDGHAFSGTIEGTRV